MRRFVYTLIVLFVLPFLADAQTTRPATAHRIVIISIDGCRPDLLLRAHTPVIHSLLPQSSFTFWARTVPQAITLPAHTSMLTGVTPRKHEIEWDKDLPLTEPVYPKFPTLMEVAHRAGYSTAMAAGKSKLSLLAKPGTVDFSFIPKLQVITDEEVAAHAVEIIYQHQPQVMFVHLPSVDSAGHKFGWSSPQQIQALAGADTAVGEVLSALDQAHLRDSTVVLITADHGGAGFSHEGDDVRAQNIPWIISGPGIRRDLDLTIYPKTFVNTVDTFATACYLLGIPRGMNIDGKPITEVLDNVGELMQASGQ